MVVVHQDGGRSVCLYRDIQKFPVLWHIVIAMMVKLWMYSVGSYVARVDKKGKRVSNSSIPYSGKLLLVQNFAGLPPRPLEEIFMALNLCQCSRKITPTVHYLVL